MEEGRLATESGGDALQEGDAGGLLRFEEGLGAVGEGDQVVGAEGLFLAVDGVGELALGVGGEAVSVCCQADVEGSAGMGDGPGIVEATGVGVGVAVGA